jgi:hypothetical protein
MADCAIDLVGESHYASILDGQRFNCSKTVLSATSPSDQLAPHCFQLIFLPIRDGLNASMHQRGVGVSDKEVVSLRGPALRHF